MVGVVLALLAILFLNLGGGLHVSQRLHSAADFAARELALRPFPAEARFSDALNDPEVFDETKLVVFEGDLAAESGNGFDDSAALDAYFAELPPINQALRPFMYVERYGDGRILRYPGRLVEVDGGLSVRIPVPTGSPQESGAGEELHSVIEEVAASPELGPFPIQQTEGALPPERQGFVHLRILYPDQPRTTSSADGGSVVVFGRILSAQAMYRREVFQ